MVMTTNAHENDPTMEDGSPWYDATEVVVAGGDADEDAIETVKKDIEVYFEGFVGHSASSMQSAYHESSPLFMCDFNPERQAPVACSQSAPDCGTYPYMKSFDALLPAFKIFVTQPSHIQLNRMFTPVGVYGDFAFVSTVSYGCEGNFVTPEDTAPMPNRELFVATRTDAGWKIRFYMFTYDPQSPLAPPVDTCDLNRRTPGAVFPHSGKELPHAILNFYEALEDPSWSSLTKDMVETTIWAHTGMPTATKGQDVADMIMYHADVIRSKVVQTTTVQFVGTDDFSARKDWDGVGAASYVITRHGGDNNTDHMRDTFVIVEGQIQMLWTTHAHQADPTMDGAPWFDATEIVVTGGDGVRCSQCNEGPGKAIQEGVEVYFNGFNAYNASAMQSAFHESSALFVCDFNTERKAPYACSQSTDCGTAPYMNSFDDLLPAFQSFTSGGNIQVSSFFGSMLTMVYGDFGFVSSVTNGCEGQFVTEEGQPPMPNRELFVATRTDSDGWRVTSYTFSFDPQSPIDPPVQIC